MRRQARDSQLGSIKSGPFLKGAIIYPDLVQAAKSPRETMVLPEPPLRAEITMRGWRLSLVIDPRWDGVKFWVPQHKGAINRQQGIVNEIAPLLRNSKERRMFFIDIQS
jgi:hypothetical protein